MKFGLEIQVSVDDKAVPLAQLTTQADVSQKLLGHPDQLEGCLMPFGNGKPAMQGYSDPLLPLVEQWLLKVPWILGGDTEVVPLRNHLFSFVFEPVGDVVDLSCFTGTKNEIEEYILEPFQVQADEFCAGVITQAKALVRWMEQVDRAISDRSPDVVTLKEALVEAEKSLKEYRLQR